MYGVAVLQVGTATSHAVVRATRILLASVSSSISAYLPPAYKALDVHEALLFGDPRVNICKSVAVLHSPQSAAARPSRMVANVQVCFHGRRPLFSSLVSIGYFRLQCLRSFGVVLPIMPFVVATTSECKRFPLGAFASKVCSKESRR